MASRPDGESFVLVLNAGSSSLKFKLFSGPESAKQRSLTCCVSGLVERIGDVDHSRILTRILSGSDHEQHVLNRSIQDHVTAVDYVLDYLEQSFSASIRHQVAAVGHRVVHGKTISAATLIDAALLRAIEDAVPLAPLHNPVNLQGINAALDMFDCPQVAVFDTAFHHSMPPAAYTYAIPPRLAEEEGLRRYGAHGISYQYLVEAAAQLLDKPQSQLDLVICHLGAGCSMAAVKGGESIDTTMGYTPLEGLMMCTRCGDIDPAVIFHLAQRRGMAPPEIDRLLNHRSGFLGMAGSADLRAVTAAADAGDAAAQLAIDVFVHRVRKYLGAYLLLLEGTTQAIIFSAGIGENSALVRHLALQNLQAFGIEVDQSKNEAASDGAAHEIQAPGSLIRILVVPTDEEVCIAEQTLELIREQALELISGD